MMAFERETGRLVAGTGYHAIAWDVPKFEIGYWVRQSAMGRGYATELTTGLLRYAFMVLAANRVEIRVSDGNETSRRVVQKIGLPFEGTARKDHFLPSGDLVDTHIYAATSLHQIPDLKIEWGQST